MAVLKVDWMVEKSAGLMALWTVGYLVVEWVASMAAQTVEMMVA
jgi:hypothetical protein